MGTDRYVEMTKPLSRSAVDSVAGHFDGPTPDLEAGGTGGSGGCSVGIDPCVMEEHLDWG